MTPEHETHDARETPRERPRSLSPWRDSLDGLLVTIPATCQELKVGRSTVYEMCARREIQSIKIGRSVRIVRASLVDLINRRMAEGSAA